ncbi:MAG: flippase [Methanosarcinaceae archaeon]
MQTNLNLKEFFGNALYTLIRRVWAIGLGLIISALLARGLGVEGRGIYALALLLPTLIIVFTNLGVPTATAYYIANQEYDLKTALQQNISLSLWISFFTISVGVGLSLWANDLLFPGVSIQLLFLALSLVPFILLNANLTAILHGLQDFKTYNFVGIFPQSFTIFFLILLVWHFELGVMGALIAYGSSQIVTVLILLVILNRKATHFLMPKVFPNWRYTKKILTFGSKAYLSNAIAFLNYRVDMFLLNFLVGTGPVGIYAITVGVGENLWILSGAVSTVLFPKIASMKDEDQQRNQLTTLVARHIFWFNMLVGLVLFFTADFFITLLYGYEYRESAIALRFLIPGITFTGMSRVLANDIAGRGRPDINTIHSVIALIINIISNFLLIPKMGASGAALASTISYTSLALLKVLAFSHLFSAKWHQVFFFTKDDFASWKKLINMARK